MNASELRNLYDDESDLHRMTSSAPPVSQNVTEHEAGGRVYFEVMLEEEPADRIGQSLSGELVALIAGIRADFTSYGPRHPVRRAMTQWERICRRRHRPPTWRDHGAGPLCSDMLYAVIKGRCSLLWCSIEWDVEYPRAERLLLSGLRYVSHEVERAAEQQLTGVHDADGCDDCHRARVEDERQVVDKPV
jgi:hypothetical protein